MELPGDEYDADLSWPARVVNPAWPYGCAIAIRPSAIISKKLTRSDQKHWHQEAKGADKDRSGFLAAKFTIEAHSARRKSLL
jgi:hypothetical protein